MFGKKSLGLYLGIFGLFLILFSTGLSLPHVGPNATNNNLYSLIARNYNRFGFFATGLSPVTSVAASLPQQPSYYFHHPPLLTWIMAIVFRLFGETFFTARISSLLFCTGILSLLTLIAKEFHGKNLHLYTGGVLSVLPALIVFGKLIGQEPLVLFFVLCSVYSLLRYDKSKNLVWLFILFLTPLLGMLSDWPFAYWSLCAFPIFFYLQKKKLWFFFVAETFFITLCILVWIAITMHGFTDLFAALQNRSLGVLLSQSFWPLRWILVILIRLCLYGTPLCIFSLLFLVMKRRRDWILRKFTLFDATFFSLTAFGSTHILLYPEGSFGHPYWMFYLIPTITLSLAFLLASLPQKRRLLFIGLFLACALLVIRWKHEQVVSQVYRYELGKKIDMRLPPQIPIRINTGTVVDRDLWEYTFDREAYPLSVQSDTLVHYLVYTCARCTRQDKEFAQASDSYPSFHIRSAQAEGYIFFLSACGRTEIGEVVHEKVSEAQISWKRKIYQHLKELIAAPQI